MTDYVTAALDYVDRWLGMQLRASQRPGCVIAVVKDGGLVLERAYGLADLESGEPLTPRHRMRVASHSKSITAAGILKLREAGKVRLDDPVGDYVEGLDRDIARATLGQILSHSAGLARDGVDSGQFNGFRPFLTTEELLAELRSPPAIEANTRFKYSNHGYGLLGLVIEAITGQPYARWIQDTVIDAAGLVETDIDGLSKAALPMARGYSGRLLLGERVPFPAGYTTHAIAPAGGLVSTAKELALFFAQLAPEHPSSLLSRASRREMTRSHWQDGTSDQESCYGLGTMVGRVQGWQSFGHAGTIQGFTSRTYVVPAEKLAVAVITNASDGWATLWADRALHILRHFQEKGGPSQSTEGWSGRWWSTWGAVDLVATGERVYAVNPALSAPFSGATEIEVTGPDRGRIATCDGYGSYGEPIRRVRDAAGEVAEIWFAGSRLLPERAAARHLSGLSETVAIPPP